MKVRKKPRVIDAVQFTGENEEEIYAAFGADGFDYLGDSDGWMLAFKTAHGDIAYARAGDWITPDHEPMTFYPIKDEVMQTDFEPFTYPVELDENTRIEDVLVKVRDSLMRVLPISQVDAALVRITTEIADVQAKKTDEKVK